MEVRPFRGWRYAGGPETDVSDLIAPPYDVLGQREKDGLLARSGRNIVAVDLPHVPPSDVGPEHLYRQAAETLNEWKSSGMLRQEDAPAVYAYEQTFRWAGRSFSRRGMICGLRAAKLGKEIIPHERTFAGPKADRLKLTEYTRMQLSAVFGFFNDPQSTVDSLLWSAAESRPALVGQLHDVTEKLYPVTNKGVIVEIAAALRDVPVFIADGHHRYATAMEYAAGLTSARKIDANHEANFVMFCLVPRSDPGLLVLPTHRIVRGLSGDFAVQALIDRLDDFSWQRCSVGDADLGDAGSFLQRYGPGSMAFMGADPAEIWIGKLANPKVMDALAAQESEAWGRLDVAVLHKLVIDKALEPWRTKDLFIDYTPDGRAVLAACQSGRAPLGICLQGTPLEAIEAIALAGGAMPPKSTYFYPKLATGMVLKPLE